MHFSHLLVTVLCPREKILKHSWEVKKDGEKEKKRQRKKEKARRRKDKRDLYIALLYI